MSGLAATVYIFGRAARPVLTAFFTILRPRFGYLGSCNWVCCSPARAAKIRDQTEGEIVYTRLLAAGCVAVMSVALSGQTARQTSAPAPTPRTTPAPQRPAAPAT